MNIVTIDNISKEEQDILDYHLDQYVKRSVSLCLNEPATDKHLEEYRVEIITDNWGQAGFFMFQLYKGDEKIGEPFAHKLKGY